MDLAVGRRVLLVEDRPGDAELVIDVLAALGLPHQVRHVATLAEAIEQLDAADPEVVLLDLRLPDAEGLECVLALRRRSNSVPIVVLTGMDDEALALECIAAGAQDYLAKGDLNARGLGRAIAYAIARAAEITERARADALHARLAAIVDASADAIVSIALDNRVTSWNRAAAGLFGFNMTEALGRPVRELIRPADAAEDGPAYWPRADRANEPPAAVAREIERLRRDGRALTLAVTTCGLHDADGRLTDVAMICRDVTEAKRRDDELRHSHNRLLASNRQMRALAARLNAVREEERTLISREVHDELGQLLTGLKMDLRWVTRRMAGGNAAPAALMTRLAETDHLIDQTIATVQRIAIELRPSALDSLGLAAAVRDEARRFETRSGVQTAVEVGAGSAPPAMVATILFRILQELLTNVARHARARSLHITLGAVDGHWALQVQDDGVGIDPAAAARSDSLGLLGISERALAIGGRFDIARGERGGTVAKVSIPLAVAAEAR